jgi:hypothetical protein
MKDLNANFTSFCKAYMSVFIFCLVRDRTIKILGHIPDQGGVVVKTEVFAEWCWIKVLDSVADSPPSITNIFPGR